MNTKKTPLVVIAGPTAVGKSHIAIEVAKGLGAEIVSADSMQIYRGMDIGTAKVTLEERMVVPHHLIDVAEPTENYDVYRYQTEAKQAIEDITKRGRLPVLVGGTGFYIQAVTRDIQFTDEGADLDYRNELLRRWEGGEASTLYQELKRVDPGSAEAIHPNNRHRVVRALEYYQQTGEPFSVHNEREKMRKSPYDLFFAVITDHREKLYDKINRRVDEMIEEGLVEEVRSLLDAGISDALAPMKSLGYNEICAYLRGECTLEQAAGMIKQNTRHYAKRQLTWFRREEEARWYHKSHLGSSAEEVAATIQGDVKQYYG